MDATPRRIHAVMIQMFVLLGLLAGCTEETEPDPFLPPEQTVTELVATTGDFPFVTPDSVAYSIARFDSAEAELGLICADFEGSQVREIELLTVLEADTAIHFPGAVLQFQHLTEAAPALVLGDRAGGVLELTGADGNVVAGEVDVLGGAAVDAWRQQTLPSLPAAAGTWRFTMHSLRDLEQTALGVGVDPATLPSSVIDALQPRSLDRARVLARVERIHHSLECAWPGRAGLAFADHVVGADLADQMSEGNPPVWLDSTHHGQLLLLVFAADVSFRDLADAVGNSLNAAVSGTAPDPGELSLDDLPGLDVSGYGVAIDGQAAAEAAASGVSGLTSTLSEPAADPGSLPVVAASMRSLDDGSVVTVAIEDEFAFTSCEYYEPVFDEVIWSLDPADARVERTPSDLESNADGEFRYNGGVLEHMYDHVITVPDLKGEGAPSVPNTFGRRPVRWPDMANGRPVIELYELGLPDGLIYSEFKFDGSPFVTTSYTLFLVFGAPERVRLTVAAEPSDIQVSRQSRLNHIIDGAGGGVRGNLSIGWYDGYLEFTHIPYQVVDPDEPPVGWHVFAFRFGNSGMTIFEDGEVLASLNWNFSLLEFNSATLCARRQGLEIPWHAVMWLAEAVAYRGDGTDEMVQEETARLMEKFGISP